VLRSCHIDAISEAQSIILTAARQDALLSSRGSALARYHDECEDAWDVEVCLPFDGDVSVRLPQGITVGELPGGVLAYTVYVGQGASGKRSSMKFCTAQPPLTSPGVRTAKG